MKKLIVFATLCILSGILFSSCRSNLSLTKRHYREGYYITHTRPTALLPVASRTTPGKPKPEQAPEESAASSGHFDRDPLPDMTGAVASTEKDQELTSRQSATLALKQKIKTIAPAAQIRQAVSDVKTNGYSPEIVGLSLFWIVILVILVLWALGLITGGFGLGPLINILLVVALVLLILWLLRIL